MIDSCWYMYCVFAKTLRAVWSDLRQNLEPTTIEQAMFAQIDEEYVPYSYKLSNRQTGLLRAETTGLGEADCAWCTLYITYTLGSLLCSSVWVNSNACKVEKVYE